MIHFVVLFCRLKGKLNRGEKVWQQIQKKYI